MKLTNHIRFIKHTKNQDTYIVIGLYTMSNVANSPCFVGYRSLNNSSEVLYLRNPNDFDGFEVWEGDVNGAEFELLDTTSVKITKFKDCGSWEVIDAAMVVRV